MKTFELQRVQKEILSEFPYLTKAGLPENRDAIYPPRKEFPANSAARNTDCPLSLASKKPNINFHTSPLMPKPSPPFVKFGTSTFISGCSVTYLSPNNSHTCKCK